MGAPTSRRSSSTRTCFLERYNMPDTLKAQYTAFTTRGRVLMSDMGRVLCSIIEDSYGWHDTLCGRLDPALIAAKYGRRRYQQAEEQRLTGTRATASSSNCAEDPGLRQAGAAYLPNVNFFSKVSADEDGLLTFVPASAPAGAFVELRAEMNVLTVLSAVPHPLESRPDVRAARRDALGAPGRGARAGQSVPLLPPGDAARLREHGAFLSVIWETGSPW